METVENVESGQSVEIISRYGLFRVWRAWVEERERVRSAWGVGMMDVVRRIAAGESWEEVVEMIRGVDLMVEEGMIEWIRGREARV